MISFVLGIVSTKIVSVFLGPSGMVLLGSFRNFSTMLKSVSTLGISTSVVALFVENKDDKDALSAIYSTYLWIFLGIAIVLGTSVFFLADTLSQLLFFTNRYTFPIRFFAILLPLIILNTFWLAVYNGLQKFKTIIIIQVISSILIFCATTFLIVRNQMFGGLLAIAFAELLLFVISYLFVRKDKILNFNILYKIDLKHFHIIGKFSLMALLSAVLGPTVLIAIRNLIVGEFNVEVAGIWDAVNRFSGFYMMFFSSGLSLYYMPKLAALKSDSEFKVEIISYFKTLVPLFLAVMIFLFIFRNFIIDVAFTNTFSQIKSIMIWQLAGDFFRVMTLAFGFQILVKTMVWKYALIEVVFNLAYLILSAVLMKSLAVEGVVIAYFYSCVLSFLIVLWMFRSLFSSKANDDI